MKLLTHFKRLAFNSEASVIVRLSGGLGNQFFQYALARRLAIVNNVELRIDLSHYVGVAFDPLRGIRLPSLQHFNVKGSFVSESKIKLRLIELSDKIEALAFCRPYHYYRMIIEPQHLFWTFDPNLFNLRIVRPTRLYNGCWQAEKYFQDIEHLIRQDLTVKNELIGLNATVAQEIESCNSVAIHVRHGDNATALAHEHGVLPLDYYFKAISIIESKVIKPRFFVFSDDPQWTRKIFDSHDNFTFVTHNSAEKDYEDLRLMTRCKSHIIANSTFSWWAAWLGKKPGQLVIAPQKVYQNFHLKTRHYYPDSWKLI